MSAEKIINEFNRIKSLGFIRSNRANNTGIGKTFEDYLGVIENNVKDADFEGFEVKSQRFLSGSYITLFTKSPSYPNKANGYLKDKYGKPDSHFPELSALHTSIFGNRWNTYISKYSLKLEVNRLEKKIVLLVKDLLTGEDIEENVYWTFDDIEASIKKMSSLFVVFADAKKEDGIEHFHYKRAKIYHNFNFEYFIDLLENGVIMFDIRIGAYKSGTNYGKPHDHGSGFRIKRDNIQSLFEEIIEID
jgi:hypothetical protein